MELSLFQMKNKLKRLKKKSTVSLSCIRFSPSMYMYSLYMYFKNFLGEGYDLAFHFSGSKYFCPGAFKPYFLLCASQKLGQQTLRAPKPLDFIIRQN